MLSDFWSCDTEDWNKDDTDNSMEARFATEKKSYCDFLSYNSDFFHRIVK